jgi:diadenosine tetraphosphate (Ap4A) HIT family hydrolase
VDCVLCQPLETYEVCSFQYWRVVVNYNQNKLGKCMICLKRHDEDICNLSQDEVSELWDVIRKLKVALLACFQPDHFNYAFLMNQDAHVHLHVIPRYRQDRLFAEIDFQDNDEVTKLELPAQIEKQIVAILRNSFEEKPA